MRSFYFRAARAILKESLVETSLKTKISKSSIHRIENYDDLKEISKNNSTAKALINYYRTRGIEIEMKGIIIVELYENAIPSKPN